MARVSNKNSMHVGSIRAARTAVAVEEEPLGLYLKTNFKWFVLLLAAVVIALLVQRNFDTLAAAINRPLVLIKLEEGLHHLDQRTVRQSLSAVSQKGFFGYDVRQAKQEIEKHPWVYMASVKRVWPETLEIQITEQVAIARWGESALLNQYGELFVPPRVENISMLPNLIGPDESQSMMMGQYQKLSQQLQNSGLGLTGLSLSERGSWQMTLNNSVRVILGRFEISTKADLLIDFYRRASDTQLASIEVIDLRYSNGLSVKRTQQNISEIATR